MQCLHQRMVNTDRLFVSDEIVCAWKSAVLHGKGVYYVHPAPGRSQVGYGEYICSCSNGRTSINNEVRLPLPEL